jgi:hypothetical protein
MYLQQLANNFCSIEACSQNKFKEWKLTNKRSHDAHKKYLNWQELRRQQEAQLYNGRRSLIASTDGNSNRHLFCLVKITNHSYP